MSNTIVLDFEWKSLTAEVISGLSEAIAAVQASSTFSGRVKVYCVLDTDCELEVAVVTDGDYTEERIQSLWDEAENLNTFCESISSE